MVNTTSNRHVWYPRTLPPKADDAVWGRWGESSAEWAPAEACWEVICQKKTADVDYVAWRHILPDGGTEYLSRTVVEAASAEAMHAFYNHDEMRLKWDGLLADASTIEVRPCVRVYSRRGVDPETL